MTDSKQPTSGDSIARRVIARAMDNGRLAHGILLYGRSREAIEELAMDVAGKLLDADSGSGTSATVDHLDFLALRPSKKMRQISAEDTREVIRRIQHTPQIGLKKVAVVFEADRFNRTSANIFLKTLEEPPLDTTILLLSTRPYSLLPTIRSRCLRIRVPEEGRSGDDVETAAWLGRYRDWLDRLAGGSPSRTEVPELVLGIYALVSDFKANLERLTKETLTGLKDLKREDLTADEKSAIEAGATINIRDGLLLRMEETTAVFARDQVASGREYLVSRLPLAIDSLEEVTGLLRVNYQVQNAVEQFLLTSLRIWTAPKG